jgi:hypothetical protein
MREVDGFQTDPREGHLLIRFDTRAKENKEKSAQEGRPIFEELEYIEIIIPGERDSVHRQVREEDKQKYKRQYADWKEKRSDASVVGTPLAMWPVVSKSEIEELAFFNIKTVEQLANVSHSNAANHRGFVTLKQKAADFLAAAAGQAPLTKMRAELDERNSTIEALQRQVKELSDKFEQLNKSKK